MVRFNVDGAQNVEVSKKLPCEKSPAEQLEIMALYTKTHSAHSGRETREAECLKVLYPRLFRAIGDGDLIAGRIDFLPIGFGCVTSVGGVGHYCVFSKLREFQKTLENPADREKVDELYEYWLENDLKTRYCREVLTENTIGRFIDCDYPLIATARLSGMMLDYQKLMDKGIGGLRGEIFARLSSDPENGFLLASLSCLDLFEDCALALREKAIRQMDGADGRRRAQLTRIADGLDAIRRDKPANFHDALQLFWLYALLAGVINYGRLDDFLGPFLVRDLERGALTEDQAYQYVKSLWTMIENRRTTVNGRIIVGGKGRRHPEEADAFLHIALKVAKDVRYVEPQFTLRVDETTEEAVWDEAMDALGVGATYPTIYNDEINVPAVAYAMRVDRETAKRYVPFGCTEFVLQGQSTGTPNICMNLLKLLSGFLNGGVDPASGKIIRGPVQVRPAGEYGTFDELFGGYKALLDYYMDLSVEAQVHSYKVMNDEVSFLFTSILMDDCIARGKALLDGGVRYLGGTNEIYGLINASDALYAIKHLVYERKEFSLEQIVKAALDNFEGQELLRRRLWECDKYGNDLDTADSLAVELYEYVAKGVRDRGIKAGMQYFLVVISNNQLNTEWGRGHRRFAGRPVSRHVHEPGQQPAGRRQPEGTHRDAQLAGEDRREVPRRLGAEHQILANLLRGKPRRDQGAVQNLLQKGRFPHHGDGGRPGRAGGRGRASRKLSGPDRPGQRLLRSVRQPRTGHPAGADLKGAL